VESEVWVEVKGILDDPCEAWVRTPIYVHSTAWYDGADRRKMRVDVHKEVIEWQRGPAEYAEERYSAGFDGESGRFVNYSTSYEGGRIENNRGELSADLPEVLKSSWRQAFTGARFSFHFFFRERDGFGSFSQLLSSFAAGGETDEQREVSREEFEGRECIRIFAGQEKKGRRVFLLEPERGYALVGYELVNEQADGRERVVGRLRVNKMKDAGGGIWWPVEASIESESNKEGGACQRLVYRAAEVVCNDPNFGSGIFTVNFPKGHLIEDKLLGIRYRYEEE
jgi:hypothetical protein